MIPLRLHLTDFLSYAEMQEPLELSNVALACLSGPNGHGKSALLDAITWSLWGKARGCEGGHEQEKLIRDGADAMRVEFVFELEGQTFRVARTRWRTGKADILFNVRAADGTWTDLAGEGIQDTQRRIVERLRMEYETFVASAFILQGRADTFTTMDPRERKDVLGKILGLEVYERLAERARERKKDAQAGADGFARALETLERDLAGRDDLERRADGARDALAAAETERAAAETALGGLRERVAALRAVETGALETIKRREDAAAAIGREEAEIEGLGRRAAELAAAARVADADRRAAARLPALERDESLAEEARTRHDELTAEARSLDARLGEERARLTSERDAAERAAAKLQAEIAAEPEARRLLSGAESEIASLDGAAAERERLDSRRAEIRERRGALDAETQARATERDETVEKIALLDAGGSGCPLCGQDLTPAHRKQVRSSIATRARELTAADRSAAKETKTLAAELERAHERLAALKAALERREAIAKQAAALGEKLERLGVARIELEATARAGAEIAARLLADDYGQPEREKLARVRDEIRSVGFDAAAHRDLKAALLAARTAERTLAVAREAESLLDGCRRETEAAAERVSRARDALASAEAALADVKERLAALPALIEEQTAAEGSRAAAQARVEQAGGALAASAEALVVLERKTAEAAEAKSARAAAKRTAGLYDKLAKAFGRDGIPARIIGNAIPELRSEANHLLGVLSDGQLAISIDPVRETKSKNLKETLEVTVYDAAGGKRSYEMYSGGERLRIDFALRVALSRLLATRAGARLETLVVDEGFGTQDAEGRARLLEAVMRVRSEFRCVLVITHIDELKEYFPVRIEVRKDPQAGSRVSVL